MSDAAAATAIAAAPNAAANAAPARSSWWKEASGFSFHDLLDAINPLQHLPVIGAIYRWATGDRPGNVARVVGDGLYGGPIGLAAGLLTVFTEDAQGRDLGERAVAAVFGGDGEGTPAGTTASATAANAVPPSPAAGAGAAAAAAVAAAPAPSPSPLALPSRPPIPLYRGAAPASAPVAAAPVAAPGAAARDFLAQAAVLQRQISRGQAAGRPVPNSTPVPLALPPGIPLPHPLAPPSPAAAAATAAPPVDISQRMLDALDKYMRLEQERSAQDNAAQPHGVDLAL